MTDDEREILYQAVKQYDEEKNRKNFDAFMIGLEFGLIKNLDNAFASGDKEKYDRLLSNIKSKGIRVLRNSDGKHKLKFI